MKMVDFEMVTSFSSGGLVVDVNGMNIEQPTRQTTRSKEKHAERRKKIFLKRKTPRLLTDVQS